MLSIAINRAFAAALFAVVSHGAHALESPPRIMQEPVLGLRLPTESVALDQLPEDIRSRCQELADDERWTGRQWIFARADDASATYYVVGGYFQRRNPKPSEPQYELDERGGVFSIVGGRCVAHGPAREVFDVRAFDETPQPVLQQLAFDVAARLARALGNNDGLRAELQRQRIDLDRLPIELRKAFEPYF